MEEKAAAWKMPPLIKVYEALGAIGDGRVSIINDTRAAVFSSEGDKTYDVETSPDLRVVSSNDNASYWQGYLGYPAIAVMLKRGFAAADEAVIRALCGIPWKELNRRFRNDYSKTLADIDSRLRDAGGDPDAVRGRCEAILEEIRRLAPIRGPRRRPPSTGRRS